MDIVLVLVVMVLTIIVLSDLGKIKRTLGEILSVQAELRRRLPGLPEKPAPAAPQAVVTAVQPAPSAPSTSPAPPQPPPIPVAAAVPAARPAPAPAIVRAAPRPPAPPSPTVEAARDILRRIWSWIVVGEEHRTPGVSMEYAVATTWLIRSGVVALVTCIGYFLKWSIDRNLLGPEARVALSVFFGLGLMTAGTRMLGRRWRLLGQGLLGGGVATLYFSIYAAGPMYDLVPRTAAFALMALVTVAVGILSVRQDSMLVAILGLIGGYCTPILLRTAEPNLPVLYAYLLLLGLGILWIAQARPWRLLNYLSFFFTYALFLASLPLDRRPQFTLIITALSALFALHASLVYVHNIRRGIKATVLEIVHLVANAALYGWLAYWIIRGVWGRPFPALATLGLAIFFVAHVVLLLRRGVYDHGLMVALLALASLFATITMPLVLARESLTIAWSLLALMFLWLGGRLGNGFLRHAGHALYLLVFGRLVLLDLPLRFHLHDAPVASFGDYLRTMADRAWTFGVSIASVIAAFFLERAHARRQPDKAAGAGIAAGATAVSSAARTVLFWFALLFVFAYAQLETYEALGYFAPFRQPALTLLWCGMAAYFLRRFLGERKTLWLVALAVFLGVAIGKTVVVDMLDWRLSGRWFFGASYTPLAVGMRWVDFAGSLLVLAAGWRLCGGPGPRRAHLVFGYGGLALLFVFLTLETRSFLHALLPAFLAGGTSVLWALFAVAFLVAGIRHTVRTLRYAGLALFTVVVGKVFLVDLAGMPTMYRVIAFMVVGVILLASAYAYMRASSSFNQEKPS